VLELIPTGLDLYQLEMDILSEGAESGSGRAALFDSAAGTFYLASDLVDPTPTQEFEVAAEYTRALLHQHYEIGNRLRSLDGDERKALDTLVLGDATLTGQEYMSTHVTPQRLVNLPTRGPMPVLDAAPYFIEQRGFFIQAGVNLMSALSKPGQTSELRLVYSNPPVSTEQLLHIEKYLLGEAPVEVSLPMLSTVLGPGWNEINGGGLFDRRGGRLGRRPFQSVSGPVRKHGAGGALRLGQRRRRPGVSFSVGIPATKCFPRWNRRPGRAVYHRARRGGRRSTEGTVPWVLGV